VKKHFVSLAALLLIAVWGAYNILNEDKQSAPSTGRTHFSLYTTGQATTPQIPLWKALADGDLDFTPEVHYWKNLDDLRGTLLAGKGDIWVGHVDGFAQAAMRGAPVQLVSVTGWKKFYILTSRPELQDFSDLIALGDTATIAAAPPHSPGVAMLKAMEKAELPNFNYTTHEPKELALKAIKGDADLLLLPEPLVTVLLKKNPKLRIIASVEEEYGRLTGKEPFMPIAGIAVNTDTLKQHPELADNLGKAMQAQVAELRVNPKAGLDALPKEFEKFIPRPMVEASLERDIIMVRSARESEAIVRAYLAMILPESTEADGTIDLPADFFGAVR